ncbi:hypothetical protein [Cohnella soli]|uniref:Intracellular septation protein A n=1 Tax=Cohnella soli TaxID=425005 RepID=A0ABW0HXK9_9BACL
MRKAYSRIAWGLVLAMLDFRMGGFDLLPDALGYVFVLVGLSQLKEGKRYFGIARWAVVGLLTLSMLQFFGLEATFSLTNGERPDLPTLLLAGLSTALELTMFYGICRGIRSSAVKRRRLSLAISAKNGWAILFAIGAASLFALPFQLNSAPENGPVYMLVLTVGYFLCSIWVIVLTRRAGRELAGPPNGDGNPSDEGIGEKLDVIV